MTKNWPWVAAAILASLGAQPVARAQFGVSSADLVRFNAAPLGLPCASAFATDPFGNLYACSAPSGGVWKYTGIQAVAVANLPPPAAAKGLTFYALDGNGATPCQTGLGSTLTACYSNGTAWVAVSGGAGGISGLTTNLIPKATSATTIGNSSITDNGTSVSTPEGFAAASLASGTVPSSSACTPGTAGGACATAGTAPTGTFSAAGAIYLLLSSSRWGQTLPGGSADIIVGAATSDVFTNKTFDTGGAGNSLKIAGTAVTALSGTGGTLCTSVGSVCSPIPCTTTITTGATATLSTCFTVNEEATASTAITYTLPTAASGAQYCVDNGNNGSTPTTGTLELATSGSGQFLVFTDGSLSASGGYVISPGAARDGACVYGIDSTHWMFLPHSASGAAWTKH
jgi:hypothetical protein